MSATKKIAGLVAGFAAVAAIGTAVAQGNPPNPLITNPAIGAGQQSSQHTAMGETGVLGEMPQVRTAVITTEPAPVAQAEPAPVVAETPAPATETTTMGAAPAPEPVAQEPAPVQVARADRN